MQKLILSILFGITLYSYSFAQPKPYGYRNENGLFSNTIFIQDGYVLDSIRYDGRPRSFPCSFIYDENGKLKRDIGLLWSSTIARINGKIVTIYLPWTRDFYYNTHGDIDTVEYGIISSDGSFSKKDSSGCKFNYSEDGKIISETRYNQGSIFYFKNYGYDPDGNLIKVIEKPNVFTDPIFTFFKYDFKNRLLEKRTYKDLKIKDSSCTLQTYNYDDASGNVLIQSKFISVRSGDTTLQRIDSLIFNGSERLSGYCSSYGNYISKFSYDQNEKLQEIESYNSFYYGAEGNLDSLHLQYINVSIFTGTELIDSYRNKFDVWDEQSSKINLYYSKKTFTGIQSNNSEVKTFSLLQNYPNPFNPETVISYQLPASGHVELKVYDILGKEIATLVNEQVSRGLHEVKFSAGSFGDGHQLTSGIYFYRIMSGDFIQTKKMLLIK